MVNRTIYVFQTHLGISAIRSYNPPLSSAFQSGTKGRTAEGWLVKTEWINDLRRLKFFTWNLWDSFRDDMSTSKKGELAVQCVVNSIKMGRFPFWLDTTEDDRQNIQIKGTDILVFCRKRIQVKCDYRGGETPLGTGNLFLQKSERNPFKMH